MSTKLRSENTALYHSTNHTRQLLQLTNKFNVNVNPASYNRYHNTQYLPHNGRLCDCSPNIKLFKHNHDCLITETLENWTIIATMKMMQL